MVDQKTSGELYFLHPETKEKIKHEDFFFMRDEDLLYLLSATLLSISSIDNQIELIESQAANSGIYQDPLKLSALKRARSSTAVLQERIHFQQALNEKKEHAALMASDYLLFKEAIKCMASDYLLFTETVKKNVSSEVLANIYDEWSSTQKLIRRNP